MKVSVIIPLYNKKNYIAATINSVLTQTMGDYEVLIIDDGSTDGSADVVTAFCDVRIKLHTQENHGVSSARNRGIELAQGDFIAFLDADDCWHPDYLEKMVALTEKYPTHNVFCSAQEGRPIRTLPNGVSIIEDHCLYDYVFFTGCMFVRRNVFDKTGGFREGIQLGEDRDMWLRIACLYPTVYLNEPTVSHPYNTENNLSRTINPNKSYPYWEWYGYPYPFRKSLYIYTTNMILGTVQALVRQKDYKAAWQWYRHLRGKSAIRPRLVLLWNLLFSLHKI